jgi:protoporphyrinogen oxidase
MASGSNVAIVGGGVLGMYLAWRLREDGVDVTILESSPGPGGLADSASIGSYTWDRFYHVILLSDLHLLEVLEELGLTQELEWGITKTGFYTDGVLLSMSNALEFLKFPPLNLVDKLRLGFTIFLASRIGNWRKLESMYAVDWLRKWSGDKVFRKIWLPLLKSKLGDNYKIASAAFIWAIIARMYAARRAGLKQEMFGYVNGGYETVLRRLQEKLDELGVRTVFNASVTSVETSDAGVRVELRDGHATTYDSAVLTVPTHAVAGLCPQLTDSEKDRLRGVSYQGIICPSFLLKRPLSPYYVTNITDAGVPFTGVIEMTALVDKANFDGMSLVYLPQYLTQDTDYWERTDEEIFEDCELALDRMYPHFSRDQVVARSISRARKVLAISTIDYSANGLPPLRTSLPNVFVLNSAQIANGTLNVNETIGVVKSNYENLRDAIAQGTKVTAVAR